MCVRDEEEGRGQRSMLPVGWPDFGNDWICARALFLIWARKGR